jgi:hypothetical protein
MSESSIDAGLRDVARKLNNLFQITLSAAVDLQETWDGDAVPQEVLDIQDAARKGADLTRELRSLSFSDAQREETYPDSG